MTAGGPGVSLLLLRGALALLAGTVAIQAAFGFAGALAAGPGAAGLGAVLAAGAWCWAGARRAPSRRPLVAPVEPQPPGVRPARAPLAERVAGPAAAAALAAALVERTWAGLHRTTFLYDVLSYHLHLPAAWHAAGRLTLVPTPFGDPAPAYTPANAELLFGVALAATGNATLAHAGQIPFFALAALAIHATARLLGAPRAVGLAAALAFLLIPEVWQQAPTAMADLAMASFFLSALPFLLRLEMAPRRWPDVLALGAALGLLLGTKYVSVVLAGPLLLWAAFALGRGRGRQGPSPARLDGRSVAVGAMAAVAFASGGFWYLRNAVVTGNPLFPATISLGPWIIRRGLLDGAALHASEYHLAVTDLGALGQLLRDCGWAFWAAVVMAACFARRTRWPALIAGVVLLLWFVVPYQQSRFFFAAWGLGAILLAAAVVRAPRAGGWALLAATAGSVLQFPTPGRLALLAAAGGAAAVAVAVPSDARRGGEREPTALFATRTGRAALAGLVALGLTGAIVWARARDTWPAYAVGDDHDAAWAWMTDHAPRAHVAYTGSNLPLPLWGPRFENAVRYVPIHGGPDAAPHQYLHVAPPAADETPSEPAPERRVPDRAAWLANLEAFGADLLFVARMYPGVARANLADRDDFPIERVWADALPDRFTLAHAAAGVRIYRHRARAGRPAAPPRGAGESPP